MVARSSGNRHEMAGSIFPFAMTERTEEGFGVLVRTGWCNWHVASI